MGHHGGDKQGGVGAEFDHISDDGQIPSLHMLNNRLNNINLGEDDDNSAADVRAGNNKDDVEEIRHSDSDMDAFAMEDEEDERLEQERMARIKANRAVRRGSQVLVPGIQFIPPPPDDAPPKIPLYDAPSPAPSSHRFEANHISMTNAAFDPSS